MQEQAIAPEQVMDRLALVAGAANDRDLADYLKVARGTISSWRCRGTVPWSVCADAARRSNTSLEWLVNGRGPRNVEGLSADVEGAPYDDPFRAYLVDNYRLIGKGGVRISPNQNGMLPFPENSFPVAFKSRYLANLCAEAPGPAYGYLCRDDAMEPTIKKDWCVLVAAARNEISEPGIYAIVMLDSGEQTFRRITPLGREIHLRCDNPAYPPMTLDVTTSPCPISVLGRAVWSGGYLI